MALLSTRESRMWVMSFQYARVVSHSFAALGRRLLKGAIPLSTAVRASVGLIGSTLPHVAEAARALWEDAGLRRAAVNPTRPAAPETASA